MRLTLITPPAAWPVSLAEAKAQCRVRHSEEDAFITRLIEAATAHVEQALSISISEQTWRLNLDTFKDEIILPRGPIISVDAFTYLDDAGISQPVGAIYTEDLTGDRPRVTLSDGESWPSVYDAPSAVAIEYTAGMTNVPPDLLHAILLLIGGWYEQRVSVSDKASKEVPLAFEALLQTHRRVIV